MNTSEHTSGRRMFWCVVLLCALFLQEDKFTDNYQVCCLWARKPRRLAGRRLKAFEFGTATLPKQPANTPSVIIIVRVIWHLKTG